MTYGTAITPGVILRKSVKVGDGTSSSTIDGYIEQAGGDSTMEFQATGGFFQLTNGIRVFHADHFFIPPVGDDTYDRIDSIWVAVGENTADTGGDPGNFFDSYGAGYEMNEGTPGPSPGPAPPLDVWIGYVHIADVLVPAGATNANQCTITDRRVFV